MERLDHEDIHERFEVAYREYGDAIFRYCFVKTSNRDVGRELTQEVFVRTLQYISSGRSIENTRAFLYTVANNLVIDWYRSRDRSIPLDVVVERTKLPEGMIVAADDGELSHALTAISGLDQRDREVLTLRYVEDLKLREIGKILGIGEGVVAVRLHRALRRLRSRLKN